MCILRLRLLNLCSPHSFSEIDRWENAVTGVLCVEKEELRRDSFFAQVSTLVPLISAVPVVARFRDQQNLLWLLHQSSMCALEW